MLPENKRNTDAGQLRMSRTLATTLRHAIPLLVALMVCGAVPAESVGLTLSTGPMGEYLFDDGNKHFRAGKIRLAHRVWANLLPDPLYGPVAYILLARGYREKGNLAKSEALLKDLLKNHPGTVYSEQARRTLAEVLCRQRKAEAVPRLKSMLRKAPAKDVPSLLLLLAGLERKLGNYREAEEHYRKLFLKYPATVEGLAASEDLAWMVVHGKIPRPIFSEKEQRARGRRLFRRGRFDLAADSYTYLLKSNPGNIGLLLRLAECRYKERKNREAIRILKGILQKKISQKERTEALYLLSKLYWRLDKNDDFISTCEKLLKLARPRMKERVLFNLGANAYEHGQFTRSLAYFSRLLNTTSRRSLKTDVQWKIAWIRYRTGNYEQAAEAFRRARVLSPGGRITNASRYWEARSLMQLKRRSAATALFKQIARSVPMDYYGQRSAALLKSMGLNIASGQAGKRSFPRVRLTEKELAEPRVRAARKLMESGLHEFALKNLYALPRSKRSSAPLVFLTAQAAYGADQYRKAQDILRTAFGAFMSNPPKDAPPQFIEMAFPRVHRRATVKFAKRHSVDPNLVWAVIRQESLYDASAVSPAGALGLMQVTPGAAGVAGRRGRIPARAIAKLLDPEKNVAYGVRILSKNLKSFRGDIVPAVASYNADIRKVRGWVKKNGAMKQDVFIENIPYLETRLYVKKVLAGYQAYTMLHRKRELERLW